MTDAEDTTTKTTSRTAAKASLRADFIKLSGYKEEDVIGLQEQRRTVVTSNGGKYQITKAGKLRHLQGPATPKSMKAAEETSDE